MFDFAISFTSHPTEPGRYCGWYALPGDVHPRAVRRRGGDRLWRDSVNEAEADAGHALVKALAKECTAPKGGHRDLNRFGVAFISRKGTTVGREVVEWYCSADEARWVADYMAENGQPEARVVATLEKAA